MMRMRILAAVVGVLLLAVEASAQVTVNADGTFVYHEPRPAAPVAALVVTGTGNCTTGTHVVAVTVLTAGGSTDLSPVSAVMTCDASHRQIDLTDVAIGSSYATGRDVWLSKAGTTDPLYRVTTSPVIGNNTSDTYTVNVADGSLSAVTARTFNTAADTRFDVSLTGPALRPGLAGKGNLGSALKPWGQLFIAGASADPASANYVFTGTPTDYRTITLPDADVTFPLTFVTSITGTASQVTASASTGAVTLSLPTPINVNTTGSAATLTTPRAINGVNFDGSAAITVPAAAGTLTGTTLAANVLASSLTSTGTLTGGATGAGFTVALTTSTITGTLADARLSSNVPLINAANLFTTNQTITKTTKQFDLCYDASHCVPFTVNAGGSLAVAPVAAASFALTLGTTGLFSVDQSNNSGLQNYLRNASDGTSAYVEWSLGNDTSNRELLLHLEASTNVANPSRALIQNQTGPLVLGAGGAARFTIGTTGKLTATSGIGTGTGGNYVCIDTTTYELLRGNGSACTASLRAFKQQIKTSPYGLKAVLQLRPRAFAYRPETHIGPGTHLGFIVDELKPIIPELITQDQDGQDYGIDVPGLVPVLVRAIQELDARLRKLEGR